MTTPRRSPAPLPRDARAALAAYREAEEIPARMRDRIWDVVGAEDAPAPAFDPLDEPAPSGRRGVAWVGVGLAIAATLALAWRIGGSLAERRDAQATSPAAVMQADSEPTEGRARARVERTMGERRSASSSAGAAISPDESVPPVTELGRGERSESAREPAARLRRHPDPPRRSRVELPMPAASTSTLAAERALVAKAWRALAQGNTAGALATAAEHARRFPEGLLTPEREAIEAITRCRRGEGDPLARAAAFHGAHPRSPLAERVDDACRSGKKN
ncbi:MAG: hypothetical protein AAGF11_41470 [Myxococcota bacterium]